jgi:hypothetical protein
MKEDAELTMHDAKKLAASIEKIDKAMKEFNSSGLNRKAIVVLLHDFTEVSKRDINTILDGLEDLGRLYLEKSK